MELASYQIGAFYRWLWKECDGYTTGVTADDADAYTRTVAVRDTISTTG